MKALKLLAVGCAATFALFAASTAVEARDGRGGYYRGAPHSGGSFRGAPGPRYGGPVRGAPPRYRHGGGYANATTNFYFGYYGPGSWWGPRYWPRQYWWGWGSGYWGPSYGYGYVYPPYYNYAPPVYVAPDPPVYVERDPPVQPAAPAWWYWCADAKAYYPYVKECPGGWQRVPPQPPGERQ